MQISTACDGVADDHSVARECGSPRAFEDAHVAVSEVVRAGAVAAEDAVLVERLRGVVNLVYGETEGDIFVDGYQRVSAGEMIDGVRAGQLAVAYLTSSLPSR